ncbi:MAG: metallophosphoesterase family protein [Thermodesulfobacteriota bacterium]|nr:metallophosphoesterase family protein [Thermodesulfobacteriota bacterium]
MKIGVLSDTHLGRVSKALKKIIEVHFREADMILHAGDIVSGEVLAYLEDKGVIAVHGNMCYPDVCQALPAKRVIEAGPFKIGLTHGWGGPDRLAERLRTEFDRIDCLVYGHSHRALNTRVGSELYFNPGSATSGRHGNSIGMLHITGNISGEIIKLD